MKQHLVVGSWQDLHDRATRVRFVVFVKEQKVPAELELDELDAKCVHAVIAIDEQPAATGRLCPDGRIGRMAVLTSFRGRGLGSEILRALVSAAQLRGQHETYLHAQMHAIGFYERHGFIAEGPEFDDAGIAHRLMRRAA